jgi:hypothetical protein
VPSVVGEHCSNASRIPVSASVDTAEVLQQSDTRPANHGSLLATDEFNSGNLIIIVVFSPFLVLAIFSFESVNIMILAGLYRLFAKIFEVFMNFANRLHHSLKSSKYERMKITAHCDCFSEG